MNREKELDEIRRLALKAARLLKQNEEAEAAWALFAAHERLMVLGISESAGADALAGADELSPGASPLSPLALPAA